eukprot:TRINITY_DN15511_c0_g4_i1.p1 TRINITY_DN15511_c0_g4~~TRINITY_DN15511_c0_g4_i1.p1  ORF type:complete len:793 (+),score=176.89 TRINITY_DN15511_c0_g4_i1:72-2450(+)
MQPPLRPPSVRPAGAEPAARPGEGAEDARCGAPPSAPSAAAGTQSGDSYARWLWRHAARQYRCPDWRFLCSLFAAAVVAVYRSGGCGARTCAPPGTWEQWWVEHAALATHLSYAHVLLPRSSLIFLALAAGNASPLLLQAADFPRSFAPPTSGALYWGLTAAAPHLLWAWHGIQWFGSHFWLALVVTGSSLGAQLQEWEDLYRIFLSKACMRRYLLRTVVRPLMLTLVCVALLPEGSSCTGACAPLLYARFGYAALRMLLSPMTDFWGAARGGQWMMSVCTGMVKYLLLALPLAAAENPWRCFTVYGLVLAPVVLASIAFRVMLGVHTPSAIRHFSPFAIPGLHPMLTVRTDRMLESTATRLLSEEPYRLQGLISISYETGDGADRVQEGIDLGGLFRDWLARAAAELCSEERGYVRSETADGVQFLRLSGKIDGVVDPAASASEDEPRVSRAVVLRAVFEAFSGQRLVQPSLPASGVYRALGRLLAIAVNNAVPLGVVFAPPLLRALLEPPELPLPASCEPDDLQYVSEGTWKYLSQCRDSGDAEGLAALDLTMAGLKPGGAFCRVTLRTVDEYMRLCASAHIGLLPEQAHCGAAGALACLRRPRRSRSREPTPTLRHRTSAAIPLIDDEDEFAHAPAVRAALQMLRRGFHNVLRPDRLRELRRDPGGAVPALAARLRGCSVDVDGWRRASQVQPAALAQAEQVAWFWDYVWRLDESARAALLHWCTGLRNWPVQGLHGRRFWLELGPPQDAAFPVAHTCSLAVDMPLYSSQRVLQERFDVAVLSTEFTIG